MNESVWDIKQTLAHERRALQALEQSNERWEEINADLQKDIRNITTTGNEWKIRYESQHLYNRMLVKQLQRMRAECRMLRCGVELSTDGEIKNLETIGDCRKLLRNLKVEKLSLISLQKMYEHQLDIEAMGYYRARDALEQLTKDVRNHQDVWIREQEKSDSELLAVLKPIVSPKKLRPLVEKAGQKPVARIEPLRLFKKSSNEGYLGRFQEKRHSRERYSYSLFE